MRLRRGCGCPTLILLVFDVVFVVGAIVTLARGSNAQPVASTTFGAVLALIAMLGNTVMCVIVGLASLRGQSLEPSAAESPTPEDSSEEGEDAGTDRGEENE